MTAPATELPAGIVTFVFTDIEGSTRLMHDLGEQYIASLERHRDILREAWAEHGGYEVSAEGDAFFVAFDNANRALQACIQAQLALEAETWPHQPVRVRMGIHTGLANPHQGDYIALAVHQAARVVSAAHGRQILVSEDASQLLESTDWLNPIGRYRLRDFDNPPQLFSVSGGGFDADPREIRAVPAQGHNLARLRNQTVGREEETDRLAAQIRPGQLTTILGPGGVGKSRLAHEVGISIASSWPAGVWRVDLASIGEPGLLADAIGDAVGSPAHPGQDRWTDILEHMRQRRAVVILDNCEHLVAKCQELVDSLLTAAPDVAVIATCREPLRAQGEQLWPLAPLELPGEPEFEEVSSAPAVQLFVERARAARPTFELDEGNSGIVASICRSLDGLPLALELAAATLAFQSLREVEHGLDDRFQLLKSRTRRPGDRHYAMEGVLDWSYRLLSPAEQAAYRRVSVFGSAFTLQAAAAAASGDDLPADQVSQLVWELVDRSLVTIELGADTTRYRLLETVRVYGLARLQEEDEVGGAASALARHMLDDLGPWHPADRGWSGRVAGEVANLRGLITLLRDYDQESAQLLACTIGRHHDESFTFRSGIDELTAYAASLTVGSPARVSLLASLAYLHLRTGQTDEAARLVDEAIRLREQHDVPEWDEVSIDRTLGEIARRSGDLNRAIAIAKGALDRPLSDRGRSRMLNLLGTSAAALGAFETAFEACSDELELSKSLGYIGYVASGHGNLAEIALRLGDNGSAAHHQRQCLDLATAQGSLPMVAFSLIVASRLAGAAEEWEPAAKLHGRADAMLEEIGLVLYDDDRRQSDELLAAARDALGDGEFAAAYAAGAAMPTPDAIKMADDVLAAAASV